MDEPKKEIVKIINKMSGKYSPDIIFADWIECMAVAIQNALYMFHDELWKKREKQYAAVMKRYEIEERKNFSRMLVLLTEAFEKEMSDILGEIYMEAGCGSKQTGQFFTPFHLSGLVATVAMKNVSVENKLIINEPSVGGGGMIIAAAKELKRRGLNYQKCMEVTAQDLDWRSVYMAYVQFSLLGISAEVVQGNTLSETYIQGKFPKEKVFLTPARMGALL